jgi:hypothetical protein
MTLLWYPTYTTLARNIFGVSVSSSWRTIRLIWPILHRVCRKNMFWLSNREWQSLRDSCKKLPEAVRVIGGTFSRIYSPSNEPQQLYYSGHGKYHCIYTQIVIAADLRIFHVESGFKGHNNDAKTFRMMTPIGVGRVLALLMDSYRLCDSICPSRHPVVTSFFICTITTSTRKYQKTLEENKMAKIPKNNQSRNSSRNYKSNR